LEQTQRTERFSGTATATAVAGVATFSNLSINSAGTGYTLTASAATLTSATSSAFNVTAGAAAKLGFTVPPGSGPAGGTIAPAAQVSVEDALGNVVTTATNQITMAIGTNPASGTLSGTAQVSAVAGVATFPTLSIDNAGVGYTLAASATGLTGATSSAFNVFGAATQLGFTVQPSNVLAGASITPAVQVAVEDSLGSVVASATNQITIAIGTNPSSGTLSGTAQVNAVAGVAAFSGLGINNIGNGYTLTASASGLTGATSNPFNVTAVPPCASGSESMLNGQYAFTLRGFDVSGNVVLIGGVLTADGAGNITAGAVDMNLNAGVQPNLAIASGSNYKIGSDHRGCMAITTTLGTQNYRFVLGALSSSVATNGHMVDFDTTGPFTEGILRKQNSAAFSTAQVNGQYAFGVSAPQDNLGSKFAAMGVLSLSGGAVTGGSVDFNDYNAGSNTSKLDGVVTTTWPGSPVSVNSGGSYTVSGTNGRGTLSFTPNGASAVNSFIYVVSSSEVLIVSSDPRASNGLFAGSALQQSTSSFTNSSLSGTSVLYSSKPSNISSSLTASATIGLIMTTGASATFTFAGYNNDGGNIATPTTNTASGTFSVAANGRTTLTVGGGGGNQIPAFYLVSPGTAFVVFSGNSAESGMFEAQTSTALSGTFAAGGIEPQVMTVSTQTGEFSFTSPNVTGTSDDNSGGTLSPNSAASTTYSVDSNGVVFSPSGCTPGTNCDKIGTVISASKIVLIDAKTTTTSPKLTIADQ
jgi:hypothetical protein